MQKRVAWVEIPQLLQAQNFTRAGIELPRLYQNMKQIFGGLRLRTRRITPCVKDDVVKDFVPWRAARAAPRANVCAACFDAVLARVCSPGSNLVILFPDIQCGNSSCIRPALQ